MGVPLCNGNPTGAAKREVNSEPDQPITTGRNRQLRSGLSKLAVNEDMQVSSLRTGKRFTRGAKPRHADRKLEKAAAKIKSDKT
jgi:hypothetical protein